MPAEGKYKILGITGNANRKRGTEYEKLAAGFLQEKGYRILQTNFYSKYGEIDIVAKQGDYLVFIEVKYREADTGGHPLEAVDIRKQCRICKTAAYYCLRYGYEEDTPCRFDVIGILGTELVHVEDAFSFQL